MPSRPNADGGGTGDSNRFGDAIGGQVDVDETDFKILELLSTDARLSTRALSREIGMSPSAISERISKLERQKVLRGYRADLDLAVLGYGLPAIVGVQVAHAELDDIIERLLSVPEVESVYVVTGEWDLMVHLRVRDHHHLAEVLFDKIWSSPGFRHSETMIVLHRRDATLVLPRRSKE
ncbi:MAG TPA: Lrp/AsnC family transcriptional regulator [Isosphaeraceae bacterium]|nr:Lrp/AsnC family transcriptional regulator [Isosphaeraceae bacterium]